MSRPRFLGSTRHFRYSQIRAFFNYVIEATGLNAKNLCPAPVLGKAYTKVAHRPRKILDKEAVGKMIFNADNIINRLPTSSDEHEFG
jgi:hypothetical protein